MSISLNINAENVPNRDALIDWHKQAKPAWTLVMNGTGLCDDIHAASPKTNIIHRDYNAVAGGDDGLHTKVTAETWINNQYAKLQGRYWAYAGNEPGFDKSLIMWTLAVVKEAIRIKQPVVIFNFGVGKPENVDIWHEARAVLELACANPEYIAVGLHEYFVGTPTSGFVGGAPNGYTEKGEEVHPDFTQDWPENPLSLGMLWHCGRVLKMLDYCKAQGWQAPRVVITEHGADGVNDILWWAKNLPRTPGFENIRGWRSLREYWKLLEPVFSDQDYYYAALRYLDEHVYKPLGIEGQLIFSWTSNPQWQPDFDVSGAATLMNMLALHNAAQEPTTPPEAPADPPPDEPVPVPPDVPETPDTSDTAALMERVNRLEVERGILDEKLDRVETQLDNIIAAALAVAELLKKL